MKTIAKLTPERPSGPWPSGRLVRAVVRNTRPARASAGFTIIELMLAIGIFSMVVAAIYSTYSAILRSAKAGNDVAADMQRSRIAARTIEDALVSAIMFPSNPALYAFLADGTGDYALLSFVARLPRSFPGSGYFGDQVVRRVTFAVDNSGSDGAKLVLQQTPLLQTNLATGTEHTIVLARDIMSFIVEFAEPKGNGYEWSTEWSRTNQLPTVARFALAFGRSDKSGKPTELALRTVGLPSVAVPRDSQTMPARVIPGQVPGVGPEQPEQPGGEGQATPQPVAAPGVGRGGGRRSPRRMRRGGTAIGGGCRAGVVDTDTASSATARRATQSRQRCDTDGFAIILVLIVITVLGILAAGFAYAMKVEIRLSANAGNDSELEWLGRSGVELARYVLGQSMGAPYTSLHQLWAGGPGGPNETNSVLMDIDLQNNQLGDGRFSVKIVDLERRFNINSGIPNAEKLLILNRALTLMGVEAGEAETIQDSILDWIDVDDNPLLSGTEGGFYLGLERPYSAKNGPIDDLAELLLVRGVTPEIYWGPRAYGHQLQLLRPGARETPADTLQTYPFGLVDVFTPLSNGRININTAPIHVLQLLPGVDENVAANIIRARAGPDGAEGTEDDTPFLNVGGLNPASVPGIIPEMLGRYAAVCSVQSGTFEVTVDTWIGNSRRTFVAIVRRNNARQIPVLQFSWQ